MAIAMEADELIIPGLFDSAPDHWQSRWVALRSRACRVELGDWQAPSPDQWVARLDRAIARRRRPVILVAHSLGCLAVAWWAREASAPRRDKVRAALLVAPPDVDRPDALSLLRPFAPTPQSALPFRALLVASQDDRYASFARSGSMARSWGAELIDAGHLGHINAESRLGDWPQGQKLLARLQEGVGSIAPGPHRSNGGDTAPAVSSKHIG